ncbi:hypothetical protein M407DRAFT_114934 [Tulasnella calospora MUT 4182]|uniref:Uncharacterized protein n=1 Tax=Tulasnella calospora MUT 4182 TaxID=1051891 RepID=A0A0C3Q2U2_9AGAM|nr:hypothetical protein M407DRAFT_114934 [Tulasnella calospora MUT 4182]
MLCCRILRCHAAFPVSSTLEAIWWDRTSPEVRHVRTPFTEDDRQPPKYRSQCSLRALEMRLWRPHNIALTILQAGVYNAAAIDVKRAKGVQPKKGPKKRATRTRPHAAI